MFSMLLLIAVRLAKHRLQRRYDRHIGMAELVSVEVKASGLTYFDGGGVERLRHNLAACGAE
jgi:hypothetical protein